MNFNVNTYHERSNIYNLFKDLPHVTCGVTVNTMDGRFNFLKEIKQHKFVLCPRGNGVDTHRLWETLYMGSIPVVQYDPCHSEFADLPILFINDWNTFSQKSIEELDLIYNIYMNKVWKMDKLNASYWENQIVNLLFV